MIKFIRVILSLTLLFNSYFVLFAQGNQSKCISKYERALKLFNKSEFSDSKELIQEINGQCPDLINKCNLLYANICYGLGDFGTSIDYYTKYISTLKNQIDLFDQYDKIIIYRGNAYYYNNSINEAIQDYEQAIRDIGCYDDDVLVKLDIEYLPVLFNLSDLYEKKYYETNKAIYLYKAVKIGVDLYYMTNTDYKCDYCKYGREWVTKIWNRLFNELYKDDNNDKTLSKREYRKFSYFFESYWSNYLKDSIILGKDNYYIDRNKNLVILGNNLKYSEIRNQLERILKYSKYSEYAILVEAGLGDWKRDHLKHIYTKCTNEVNDLNMEEKNIDKRINNFLKKGHFGFWVELHIYNAEIKVLFEFRNCQFSRNLGEKIAYGEAGFDRWKSKYVDIAFECECPEFDKIKMIENCLEEMTIFKKKVDLDTLFSQWKISGINEAKKKVCNATGSFKIEELESYNLLSRFIDETLKSLAEPQEIASQSETSRFEWIENNSGASLLISKGENYGGTIYITDNGDAIFGSDVCKDSYSATFISQSGNRVIKNDPFNDDIDYQSNDLPAILEINYQEGCSGSYRQLKLLIKTVQEFTISF